MDKYNIFKEKLVEEVECVILDELIDIKPEHEKQDSIFFNNKKIHEEVMFKTSKPSLKLFRLFMEAKVNRKTGKLGEDSRINFITVRGFPDGCFYIEDSEKKEIDCYICELKHNPGSHAVDIAKQFYMGLLHCKTFFSSIKFDEKYKIKYHFFIVGFLEQYEAFEKQIVIPGGVVKAAPGVLPAPNYKLTAYKKYKECKIYFSYTSNHSESFEFPFKFIQLEKQESEDTDTVKLAKSLVL